MSTVNRGACFACALAVPRLAGGVTPVPPPPALAPVPPPPRCAEAGTPRTLAAAITAARSARGNNLPVPFIPVSGGGAPRLRKARRRSEVRATRMRDSLILRLVTRSRPVALRMAGAGRRGASAGRGRAIAVAVACALGLVVAAPAAGTAHEIPPSVTVLAYLKPEGRVLRLVARVPLE